MGLGGLEPPTSRLSGVRSSQLSYRPRWQAAKLGDTRLQHPKFQRATEPQARSFKTKQQTQVLTIAKPLT